MVLARTVARPIDRLTRSLTKLAGSRDLRAPIARTGSSLEVDTLTDTFNNLMATLTAAELETRSTYVGAIRALALALDARDGYTAGHSERVSAISGAVGHQLRLGEEDLDVLRLGALLHDIGKIGISDDVLLKAGPLTDQEYEAIKEHPTTGARILRSVAFLAPHLPIVRAAPRASRRQGLSARPDGRRDPAAGAHRPRRRRVRRDDQRARLPSGARRRRGAAGALALRRHAVRRRGRAGAGRRDADHPSRRLHRFDAAAARAGRKTGVVAFNR